MAGRHARVAARRASRSSRLLSSLFCRGRRREPLQVRLRLLERARITNRVLDPQQLRLARDVRDPVAGIGVIAQPLWTARSALLLDRLEHVGHLARVVAGARHDVGALQVRLLLVLAAESQERRAETKLRALRDRLTP